MFTKTMLEQLASPSSYSRGKHYVQSGAVRTISRSGYTFTAKVDGSQRYTVSLTLTPTGPAFTCSCPYHYEGICKHSVALGLAAIEQFGTSIEPADEPAGPPAAADLWEQTTEQQKLDFLRQLLDKQPNLCFQLAMFAGVAKPMPVGESDATLTPDEIGTGVYERLTDLRFDETTYAYDDEDWYSEDRYDVGSIIADVLEPYALRVSHALREGRLADAMTICMGVYEGTQAATEPAYDEYGIIDSYPEETLGVWLNRLTDPVNDLALRVFNTDQLGQALNQLADRMRHFDELEAEAANDDDHEEDDGPLYTYNLKAFESLLLALVTDEPSAVVMQEAITQHGWQHLGTDYLQLRIADKRHDPEGWLRLADQFAETNSDIALQLLNRHRLLGNQSAVVTLLHRLKKPFPKQFDAFILEHLSPETLRPGPDQKLYLDALRNRCISLGQLPDYLTLRTYLTPAQRQAFINGLNLQYQPLFYMQVLHTEGRTDGLLPMLETMTWYHTPNMDEIVALVAQTYPTECLTLTRKKATHALEKGKRDRYLYGAIASWIAALHNVPSLRIQAAAFTATLVSTYPRLIALRDELRMKGLVR